MNAIRNYLDNMFRNLPNTEEVRRAKAELLEMMEDKYEELISEGKTENEAVGIVISEFGNLDELADSLGISEAVSENPDENKPMLSIDRVKDYLTMTGQRSILLPLGVALCIFSVAFNIITEVISDLLDALGVSAMFMAIAAGVVCFIISGIKKKEFAEVYKKECSLSIESAEYVRAQRKNFKSSYGLMSSFGIGLCILSVVNPIIIGSIPLINNDIGGVLFFAFIALGVFLIMSANVKMNGYDRLLELNEAGKMSEEFVPKSDRKVNKTPIIICAVAAVVISVVIGGISVMRSLLSTFRFIGSEAGETMSTTYDVGELGEVQGDIKSVKLDLTACEVKFKTAEGSGLISVDYSGPEKYEPQVSFENGKLVLTQKVTHFQFKHINDGPKVEIVLGTDVDLESLEMTIDAGDIKLSGVSADYVFGDIDAGNIEIRDCSFRKVDFDVNAGNFDIRDSSAKILKIETDAGNIEIKKTALEDVEINVDFGNVDIEDIDNLDEYDIECEIDAGIVRVGKTSGGRSYSSKGNGSDSIKINVDAGNIEID
ncbi:MAG: DUF4097 family beta strand repeat protein [Lachnospiraceae bacterium]|nr:DUF4097 family beta strand repeat protein [Lachnospiraceae bacterium]